MDDSGQWCSADFSIVPSHLRLSIFDLNSAGIQSIISDCEWLVIVFNGMIRNVCVSDYFMLCGGSTQTSNSDARESGCAFSWGS